MHIIIAPNALPKKMMTQITPSVGFQKFTTFGIQGLKATGNGQTIAKTGGVLNYFSALPYTGPVNLNELEISLEVIFYQGAKELERKNIRLNLGGQVSIYYADDEPPLFTISGVEVSWL